MTRPIAKPAHVSARPRRRQGSRSLFRAALLAALAGACIYALPLVASAVKVGIRPSAGVAAGQVPSPQVVLPGLAPGACMSFMPSAGGSSAGARTVFIDPGHGGLDPGVVGSVGGRQVLEKTVALNVGARLGELLREDGFRVVLSRTGDTSVMAPVSGDSVAGALTVSAVHRDLVSRIACANAASASVLVSIHFDAFDDQSVGGAETFFDTARAFAGSNRQLATDLQSALVAELGVSDRGVWTDDQVGAPTLTTSGSSYDHLIELGPAAAGWVEQPTAMPGALVEPLFLTNPAEARLANDQSGQARIASALRSGIEKYFNGS